MPVSNIFVSKLDIDVLVHLALGGPSEAGSGEWHALVDEPDSFGARLWAENHGVAGYDEPPPPVYRFAPLPFDPTAAEGVKQIQFYRYQSTSEAGMPLEIERWLVELEQNLIDRIPQVAEAPWGFTASDVNARRDRPASRLLAEALAEDPRIEELRVRLDAAGLPIALSAPDLNVRAMFGVAASEVLAHGHWYPPGTSGFAPVNAVLCDSALAAERVYLDRCNYGRGSVRHDRRFYRFNCLVITTSFALPSPGDVNQARDQDRIADVARRIALLGTPDEFFDSQAPPIQEVTAEILATKAPVAAHEDRMNHGRRVVLARTANEIEKAAAYLNDPAVAAEIRATSSRKHSILILWGVDDVASVEGWRCVTSPG